MIESYQVQLVGGVQGEHATFEYDDDEEACRLSCRYRDRTIQADAIDYFEALRVIRRQLEAEGLIPCCYGASLNVWPSAMSSQMGGGIKAYRRSMGRHAQREDLRHIFETGDDVEPASVDAQEHFNDEWIATLRR